MKEIDMNNSDDAGKKIEEKLGSKSLPHNPASREFMRGEGERKGILSEQVSNQDEIFKEYTYTREEIAPELAEVRTRSEKLKTIVSGKVASYFAAVESDTALIAPNNNFIFFDLKSDYQNGQLVISRDNDLGSLLLEIPHGVKLGQVFDATTDEIFAGKWTDESGIFEESNSRRKWFLKDNVMRLLPL